jgi:hypothetical protein
MSEQKKRRKSKRPRPSYEDGELRDKSIEEKMDPDYRRENLRSVIREAAKKS